ncbi:MAG: phosphoenolpyruvate--protein phosphotransferase [bacterium]|nr:phosphoenolpyruvate--protein phosphotransferase [bacterium]
MSRVLDGVGVSPGVAIGSAYLLHPDALPVVPSPLPPERLEAEIEAFDAARAQARVEVGELRDRVRAALGDQYAAILEAQLLMLDDPALVEGTLKRVRVGRVSARWALKEVVADFARRFEVVDDAYLRERVGDLADVHRRMQRILRGDLGATRVPDGPLVVVAHTLVPSDAMLLTEKQVVGLASDAGGRTSHTAILAQALSVPAVAGLSEVSERVLPGQTLVVDGTAGRVHLEPDEAELTQAREQRQMWIDREELAAEHGDQPAVTLDGTEIVLRANVEFPHEAEAAVKFGARGIGLYRSEFLFLSLSPELPTEEQHYDAYMSIAESAAPHPAVVRTLDLGGEKYFHEVLDRNEANPVLGLRGVRLCLRRPDVFRPQLRGLLRASTCENLQILLPLVTTVDEVREVRRLLAEEAERLRGEGHEVREEIPLGVMIEVPGAAAAADLLAQEADFFSIGTNDLIQYALAVDRGNDSVGYLYRPLHPGVLRTLKWALDGAARAGIPIAVCGEMAADPELVDVLVGLGVRELSVQPRAIPAMREVVGSVTVSEAERGVAELLGEPLESPVEAAGSGKSDKPPV